MIGIYVHIPFCRTRCPYCDFLRWTTPSAVPSAFVDALCREIAAFDGPKAACSIFCGGGTPSLLAIDDLRRILDAIGNRFVLEAPEITLEVNADDVNAERARAWRDAGINRLSIGVQSFDDAVLRYLGRRHDAVQARKACEAAAAVFDNWSMDLIFGAPPFKAWTATLEEALRFAPTHVSAYGLAYEQGTPFEARRADAVNDETWLALYRETETILADYAHYEISNYARPGCECRHNLIYWHNEEYAGFGPGAYSFLDGVRSRNTDDLDPYLAEPGRRIENLRLTNREIRLETVIQYLRLREGLPKRVYADRFGNTVESDFGVALHALAGHGLIEETATAWRPTSRGFELNNEIGLALVSGRGA
ncbi:MAG TPA: radical SAM family heme chaperone HemW [Candidatus Hydrogenedentes bacterium]|nr:radical SAM family heme chaperone HemW [Candidatus Hydrogenedentota bacterium]HPC16833.1 radical SAM family heme chaperone HemW [Candidatus Hydrogenedentota bacterium]HRT21344.1 radical SAM family heme chaperone HemW [Candidatus Hydrogenedentota bacterium]HRT66121.1 radical SAM family heme chaperone HemW [Candidatus Hydrogenedentota bacterium]